MRKIVTLGLVALAVLLGGAGQAAATVRALTAPADMRAETGVNGGGFFSGGGSKISCGSPEACLAIGENVSGSSGTVTPVAEAWNGKAWKSVDVKAPKRASVATLTGVSCRSATSCLVVGGYLTKAVPVTELPYAMTWNGTSLTPTAALPAPKGDDLMALDAVSCVTARSCIAVGVAVNGASSAGTPRLAVATWDGAKWALRTAQNPGGAELAEPAGISCFSVTSCIVAGTSYSATNAEKMLIAAWNGKAFTAMKAAAPAGAGSVLALNDVSCPAVRRCVAAGVSTNSAGTRGFGFTEVWNGTAWTADKVAWPKGDTESFAFGVSCATPANCVAVGAAGTSERGSARALSYNGKTWSQLSVPGPGKGKSSVFEGVSCPKARDCVAIGVIGATKGDTLTQLAGRWNGTTWKMSLA